MRLLYFFLYLAVGLLWIGPSNAATELEDRAAIAKATQNALVSGDFSTLEALSSRVRQDRSRTSSGLWVLSLFYMSMWDQINALGHSGRRDTAFAALERITSEWMRRYPRSPSAHIVHGMVLIGNGVAIRGDAYAIDVKPESWAPFRKYVRGAREHLERHKSFAAADPGWYVMMLTIARLEDWERTRFDRLLDEALAREPLFYQTYFTALEYLLPKWHGGLREIEQFAQDAVERTSNAEGTSLYARIYWVAAQTEFQNEIFSKTYTTWPRMRAGFEDMVARYPDAWNLNTFAKFACLAQDAATTRALLERIGPDVVLPAWEPQSLHGPCSEWAVRQQIGEEN